MLSFAVALNGFWIWMVVHAIQNKALTEGEKIGWVLTIALLHVIGGVLYFYFFIGKPKAKLPPLTSA